MKNKAHYEIEQHYNEATILIDREMSALVEAKWNCRVLKNIADVMQTEIPELQQELGFYFDDCMLLTLKHPVLRIKNLSVNIELWKNENNKHLFLVYKSHTDLKEIEGYTKTEGSEYYTEHSMDVVKYIKDLRDTYEPN